MRRNLWSKTPLLVRRANDVTIQRHGRSVKLKHIKVDAGHTV